MSGYYWAFLTIKMFFVLVGNNQEWSGMISLTNCWALLGIADYDNNQWGPLGGLVFEGHKDGTVPLATCSAWRTIRSQSMT